MQHLVFLLLGLGNGAVFGALALAVVLAGCGTGASASLPRPPSLVSSDLKP